MSTDTIGVCVFARALRIRSNGARTGGWNENPGRLEMLDWLSLTEDGVEDDIGRAECSLERLDPVHHWNTKVLCLLEETDVDILVSRFGVVESWRVAEVVEVPRSDQAVSALSVSMLRSRPGFGSGRQETGT
jgi:hypothetical protein